MPTNVLNVRVDPVMSLTQIEAEIRTALTTPAPWLCTFVNPASTILAHQRPGYVQLLERFDRVLADGSGMVMGMRLLHKRNVARISFDNTSLAPVVFRTAAREGLTVALCGGKPGIAEQAAERIEEAFGIRPLTYDGYAGIEPTVEKLVTANPRIVVVGMGAVLQETVLLDMAARGWRGLGFTCGGYIDQLAKRFRYYPDWVDRWNLRFAYRLCNEPMRLWRRYLLHYPLFLVWLGRELARKGR